MRTITVTAALKELKLYNDKINKKLYSANFAACAKKASDKVGHKLKVNFINDAKADYQSVQDLIAERAKIKSEIVKSNAETIVEIVGMKMTRAEAIERKDSIEYDKNLLNKLRREFADATNEVQNENLRIDRQCDSMIEKFLEGKDKKVNQDDIDSFTGPYRRNNEVELIDPIGIEEEIRRLEKYIDDFEANVDIVLSVSNSTTTITV